MILRLLKRFWRCLVALFGSRSRNRINRVATEKQESASIAAMSEAEYEQIFMQLLNQVTEGFTSGQIKGFLFSKNISEDELVVWLQNLGERILSSSAANEELATRLILLGNVANGKLAMLAENIGNKLLERKHEVGNKVEKIEIEVKKLNCQDAEDFFNRGLSLGRLDRYEEAIVSYDKAIELQPDCYHAWYNRGISLYDLGRYEEAIVSYDKAIELRPNDFNAWHCRGVSLASLDRYEEAIVNYDKAIELRPNDFNTWYNRGVSLASLDRYEEEIVSLDKAIELRPNDFNTWYNLGVSLASLDRYEEAIVSLDKAIELRPNDFNTWHNRGFSLASLDRYEEAIVNYDKAIELRPDYFNTWYNRGVSLASLDRYEEAIVSLDKAIELRPNDFDIWHCRGVSLASLDRYEEAIVSLDKAIELRPNDFDIWHCRGVSLASVDRYEEAIVSFDKAIELRPNDFNTWYSRGVSLASLDRYEEAIVNYDKAIELRPDDFDIWHCRGVSLASLDRYEEAIVSFDRVIELRPDYFNAWYNRGFSLASLDRYEEAIVNYDKAIELRPDYFNAWHNRGVSLASLDRYEEAIVNYDKAIELRPDYFNAWHNRGVSLASLDRYEEAIVSLDKAIELRPNDFNAWHFRGVSLASLDRYEEAIVSLDKAIELRPNDFNTWYNRGVSLASLDRYEEAIVSFDKAIELRPNDFNAWHCRGIAASLCIGYDPFWVNLSRIAKRNPELNKRGYEGQLVSYLEGLKYIHQDTHAEGWGRLHQAIGNAHYQQWKNLQRKNAQYWNKAIEEYNEALKTLKNFPELHINLLKDFIHAYSDVGKREQVEELYRRAWDLIQDLLSKQSSNEKKKQLFLKYAWLEQLTVDIAVQNGELVEAWQVAEKGKNACLTWLLSGWQSEEDISSPNYQQIQRLLIPTTAIIYWHISPICLHTFILKYGAAEPIVDVFPRASSDKYDETQLQKLQEWLSSWNSEYLAYGKQKEETDFTWRNNLPSHLQKLKSILRIDALVDELGDVTNLILIPHQELHCLPLSSLFPPQFTITYLPCVQIALTSNRTSFSLHNNSRIFSVECSASNSDIALVFSEIESEIICRLFDRSTRISEADSDKQTVAAGLSKSHEILHFTGHGIYNFTNPKLSALILDGGDALTLEILLSIPFPENNYQIVTLSACETALAGNQSITTEYVGLVSGFLRWGAAYVLSTLWQVEDAANAILSVKFYQLLLSNLQLTPPSALAMATQWLKDLTVEELKQFYIEIRSTLPKEEATVRPFLRTEIAKLNRMESETKLYAHPYYWAGYKITGKTLDRQR